MLILTWVEEPGEQQGVNFILIIFLKVSRGFFSGETKSFGKKPNWTKFQRRLRDFFKNDETVICSFLFENLGLI